MSELRFGDETSAEEWQEAMEFFDYCGEWNEDGDYSAIME